MQIMNIRKERNDITTNIKRITREYYEQIYTPKIDNLHEMDKFLESLKLSMLTEEQLQ